MLPAMTNWLDEMIELKLAVTGTASVSPDIYTLAVTEADVAPVAKFKQPSFTLSEQSERECAVGRRFGETGCCSYPPGCYERRVIPRYVCHQCQGE